MNSRAARPDKIRSSDRGIARACAVHTPLVCHRCSDGTKGGVSGWKVYGGRQRGGSIKDEMRLMRGNLEAVIKLSRRGGKKLAFFPVGKVHHPQAQSWKFKVGIGMAYQGYHIRSAMTKFICPVQLQEER